MFSIPQADEQAANCYCLLNTGFAFHIQALLYLVFITHPLSSFPFLSLKNPVSIPSKSITHQIPRPIRDNNK